MRKLLAIALLCGFALPASATITDSEPNDHPDDAIVFSRDDGTLAAAFFLDDFDVDYLKVSLLEGDMLTVVTTPMDPFLEAPDTLVGIFFVDDLLAINVLLDEDDFEGPGGTGSALQITADADGMYLIGISGLGDDLDDDNNYLGDHDEYGKYLVTINIMPIPEPSTMLLMGAGLAGLLAFGRRVRS